MERYEKVHKLGSGTFGMVYLIRRKEDGEFFALKRVPLDKDVTDETRAINNEVSKRTQSDLSTDKNRLFSPYLLYRLKCYKV